jgi:hypothetical protein
LRFDLEERQEFPGGASAHGHREKT